MNRVDFKKFIWDCSRELNENTNTAFNPVCERYGLTMLQVRILVELQHNESYHTIGSLAQHVHMAGANISSMCKKLESMGFLERIRDQQDERVVKLVLTNRGSQAASEIDQELDAKISLYMKDKPKHSLDDIILGLQKLNELLQ